jgi:hypothetical protein
MMNEPETLMQLMTRLDGLYSELRQRHAHDTCKPEDIARIQIYTMMILGRVMYIMSRAATWNTTSMLDGR